MLEIYEMIKRLEEAIGDEAKVEIGIDDGILVFYIRWPKARLARRIAVTMLERISQEKAEELIMKGIKK